MKKDKWPKHWIRAFYGEVCKCDMVDNNGCEAFNSIILDARCKSIITMLEDIREETMKRIAIKRQSGEKWKNNYGPLVKRKFDEQKKGAVEWQMVGNADDGCQIKKGRLRYIVDLKKNTCSCRFWQISGIPCMHACCAIWHNGGDPDDYIDSCYHKETYLKAYEYTLQPINGSHDWVRTGLEAPLPPIAPKNKAGRPKKNRRKSKDEPKKKPGKISKKGIVMSCSLCHQEGHNKASCSTRVLSHQGNAKITAQGDIVGKEHAIVVEQAQENVVQGRSRRIQSFDKRKGKVPVSDASSFKGKASTDQGKGTPNARPVRFRKPSIKGYGLYTNEKIGKQTFYSGFEPLFGKVGSSSRSALNFSMTTSPKTKKRKATANLVGPQEESIEKGK